MKSVIYELLQSIWGFPQTLVGLIVFIINAGKKHYFYHGCLVTVWHSKSSLSLGLFVFISDDPFYYYQSYTDKYTVEDFSKMLLVHEYGHTIQSIIFGPFYLLAVGVPSIAWSFMPTYVKKRELEKISYFSAYPEKWANSLGERITGETSIGEPVEGI